MIPLQSRILIRILTKITKIKCFTKSKYLQAKLKSRSRLKVLKNSIVTLKASGSAVERKIQQERDEEQKFHSNYRIFKSMRNKLSNEIENMRHISELKKYSENSPIYESSTIPDDINNCLSIEDELPAKSLQNKYKRNVNLSKF